mgnify:FL=1
MATTENIEVTDLDQYLDLKIMGFEFTGQSYLFWEYMRILTEVRKYNPDVKFLLENVVMSKKWEAVLTNAIGVEPVMINSNLVSAQNRKRLYWTNIAEITQPEDEGIFIRDILERDRDSIIVASRGRTGPDGVTRQHLEPRTDGKSNCLTTVQKDNLLAVLKEMSPRVVDVSISENGIRPHRGDARKSGIGELGTIRFESSKADTLLTSSKPIILDREWTLRRLTPVECARLQTVPDWYEWVVSDTQIYRMCGNGWTVRVIEHILKNLFV